MISRFAQRQTQPGTRDLAHELKQAKNEIFQLKLRIHCLEENQGLLDKKGSDSEDNVYKVNIDLRVDILEQREVIKEKDNMLREALTAIESLEKEKDQKRGEVEVLKQEIEELKTADGQKLSQAFESLNLGAPLNDENENAKFRELQEKISGLEGELEIERDHCQDLQNRIQLKEQDLIEKEADLEQRDLDVEAMKNVVHQKDAEILDAQGLLNTKEALILQLQEELKRTHENTDKDKSLLEDAINLKQRYEDEIGHLTGMSIVFKRNLSFINNSFFRANFQIEVTTRIGAKFRGGLAGSPRARNGRCEKRFGHRSQSFRRRKRNGQKP